MSILTWFKGVKLPRPPEAGAPQALETPERVYLPLKQHRGADCRPAIRTGETVAMGQVVGRSPDWESAPVHASVSGTVEAITDVYDPSGQKCPGLVIVNDKKDTWWEPPAPAATVAAEGEDEDAQAEENAGPPVPLTLESPDQIGAAPKTLLLERLRDFGVVRHAARGLPVHVELSPPRAPRSYMFMTGQPVVRAVDTLIVRAVDLDPPVCPNQSVLGADLESLELGVAALKRISGAEEVIFAVPSGQTPEALSQMAEAKEWRISGVNPRHYPYATNELLIHSLTGRVVPTPYGEPRDVGVVLQPLVTVLEIGKVLRSGKPVLDRPVTVAGAVARPGNYLVRLGTPVGDLLQAVGGASGKLGKVILGGPMRGYAHFDLATPITKEVAGVFVQSEDQVSNFENQPCIHCGRCVASCPVNLIPSELSKLCEFRQFEQAADSDLFHCIECGCCAYVCPSRRPMVHLLRHGKSEVLSRRMEL